MQQSNFLLVHSFPSVEKVFESIHVDPEIGFHVSLVAIILLLFAFFAGHSFRKNKNIEPTGKLSFSFLTELSISGLESFNAGIINHPIAKRLFCFYAPLAGFILLSNLLGLIPGFEPPTQEFNMNFTLAICVFILTHIIGIRAHGFSYIKQFLGPVWWLAWLMFPIELVSHLVRPISLALRLLGNMRGDHMVASVFFGMFPLLLPLPFIGLGLFVAMLQTFVFLLLSLVYIQMALDGH